MALVCKCKAQTDRAMGIQNTTLEVIAVSDTLVWTPHLAWEYLCLTLLEPLLPREPMRASRAVGPRVGARAGCQLPQAVSDALTSDPACTRSNGTNIVHSNNMQIMQLPQHCLLLC